MDKNKWIVGEWKFDEEIGEGIVEVNLDDITFDEFWNNDDIYKPRIYKCDAPIPEETRKFMQHAKEMYELAKLINILCPNLTKTEENGELAVNVLSSYPLTTELDILVHGLYFNGYRHFSDVAKVIIEDLQELKDEYMLNEEPSKACAIHYAMGLISEKYLEEDNERV